MLAENNRIILVDDNEDDLKRLSSIFAERGIGCRAFPYDGISFPATPLTGVRMVFMDVNLANSGDTNSQFAVLVDALRSYVSKENYFVLVFWTTHVGDIDEFKAFVNRDTAAEEVPKPMLVVPLDKAQFVDDQNALEDKLSQIFEERLVKCLLSFDEDIQKAANKCLTDIVKLAPFDDNWGDNTHFETNVRNLFTKIAIKYSGLKLAKANPDKAIKEIIAPSFLYDLKQTNENTWKEFLDMDEKDEKELKQITFPGENISAKLNTILNIDPSTEEAEARGSVRRIKTDVNGKNYFENAFSVSEEDFVKTKMVFIKDEMFINEATIIAVEISAACDYSNDKPRVHHYMLGIICKKKDFEDHVNKKGTKLMGEHLLIDPFDFIYEGDIYCMVLNLNYTFSEEATEVFGKLGERIFGLKSEFMNKISEKYSQHISRIGYTAF